MGKLDLDGAARAFGESLRIGRRTADAWLESLALNRLPIVLAWQGRLDEARSYLLTAFEAADTTGDWADYSLALGMLAALALARGEFEEVESLARQAVSIARRSGYLWGAALAVSAVAPARALRGRLDQARDAAALLETPGVLAREVPPAWGAVAAVLRLRLSALAGLGDRDAHQQATGLAGMLLATETDPQILPALCCCVEIANLQADSALAERAAGRIAEAARCGVVFTSALDDVLARVLGLAAEASGRREEARARFEEALEAAERGGARMLQARIHADLARVQGELGDAGAAMRNYERALVLAERLGMEPLRAACAARLAGAETAGVLRERPEPLQTDERRLLRGIAAGLDDHALAADLLLTREGLGRLREQVFARIGASGNVEAAAFAHREGLVVPARRDVGAALAEVTGRAPPVGGREPRALTLFVSDIANSSELIQRLGDEEAQRVIHEHNRAVRTALRRHHGVELQHTGDGFIAAFDGAAGALRCAVELQQALDARRLGPPDAPLRIRVGLHLGEPLLEEGRLFGVSMHTAARICASCQPGEVRASREVWQSGAAGSGCKAEDLGPVALKGLFEPVSLHRVGRASGDADDTDV
jgi:class 3 adenylate cyclase/predicted negative regulator of RcsB-dependent stress response